MKIGVIGGLTMDLFYTVDKLPQKGEATQAKNYFLSPGGKALNITIAATRFNQQVFIIGSIGKDTLSEEIFETLSMEGIDQKGIVVQDNLQTDLITVLVTPDGKPSFIGTRAANYHLTFHDIQRLEKEISNLQVLLITMEIPGDVVKQALSLAKKYNVMTVLNPSPCDEFSPQLLTLTDYFIPNDYESFICSKKKTIKDQVDFFVKNGAKKIIITQEEKGCTFWNGKKITHFDAFTVDALDSTGAGDAFCGVFVSALLEGASEVEAIRLAQASGALVAKRRRSGLIMPTKKEIKNFLKN